MLDDGVQPKACRTTALPQGDQRGDVREDQVGAVRLEHALLVVTSEFMPAISVLLVPVPDAEATVAPFRRGLDPRR